MPVGYLPLQRQGPFPASDAATYYDVRDALSSVWGNCLYGRNPSVGFAVLGTSCSLRVVAFDAR